MTYSKCSAIALGLAGALAVSSAPAVAAPVLSSTTTVKQSLPSQTTEIQWRRHRGGSVAAGAAAGFIAGAAIGAATAPRYYGADPYYSGYAYAPGPTYYAEPAPSYYYAEPSYAYEGYAYAPAYEGYAYAPAPNHQYRRGGSYNNAFGCKSNGQSGTVGLDTSTC